MPETVRTGVDHIRDNPEIHVIHVPLPNNPLRNLNSYVIKTPQRNLVIDTGFNREECREALWSGIGELGLDLAKTSLFVTHLHSDHSGLGAEFADRGCPVYMGSTDYRYFSAYYTRYRSGIDRIYRKEGFPLSVLEMQDAMNQARLYAPRRFSARTVEDKQVLFPDGPEIRCLHMPGHTPGQMVLYLPESGILFSGDHILFDITPNITVWEEGLDSLADYLSSLGKIQKLDVSLVYPAHRSYGHPMGTRPTDLIRHHEARLREIESALSEHPDSTAYEVAGRISWSAHGLGWDEFPPHQRWFAMGETLAHLIYLANRGRVIRTADGDRILYHI